MEAPPFPSYVTVGPGTYFANCRFHRYAQETIRIGNYCSIAQEVLMIAGGQHRTDTVSTYPFDVMHRGSPNSTSRHYDDRTIRPGEPTIDIGNDVWIGWGAKIVSRVEIGHGAVIASEAVVMGTMIPPYGIAVGNPARVNKFRFDEQTVESLLSIQWWNWDERTIRERADWFYRPVGEFIKEFGK